MLLLGVNIVYHRIRVNKGASGCGKYCSIKVNVAAVNIVYHRISANQSVVNIAVLKFELLQAVNIV
jgi:hypothetical protein